MHFSVNINNSKLQYRNPAASWSKSDFSVRLGFETELNGHTPVGSWRCQTELALLALTCQCLRQIKVNQICVRGLLLRAPSHFSWQQWALWWIAVRSMKPHLSVQSKGEKSTCVKTWRVAEGVFHCDGLFFQNKYDNCNNALATLDTLCLHLKWHQLLTVHRVYSVSSSIYCPISGCFFSWYARDVALVQIPNQTFVHGLKYSSLDFIILFFWFW